jgi:hypothetical protein
MSFSAANGRLALKFLLRTVDRHMKAHSLAAARNHYDDCRSAWLPKGGEGCLRIH